MTNMKGYAWRGYAALQEHRVVQGLKGEGHD